MCRSPPPSRAPSPARVAMTSTAREDSRSRFNRDNERSAGPDQRYRLVALEQIEQTSQRLAALSLQPRIVLHDAQRLVASLGDELAMHVGTRDAIAGQAALPDAEHVAFTAQF